MVLENRVLEMDELGMFFPPRLDQKEGIHPSSARRIPEPSKRKEPGFRATTELHVASYSRYQEACLGVTDSSPVPPVWAKDNKTSKTQGNGAVGQKTLLHNIHSPDSVLSRFLWWGWLHRMGAVTHLLGAYGVANALKTTSMSSLHMEDRWIRPAGERFFFKVPMVG